MISLFTTTEELQQYIEVSAGTSIETIQPSIRIAERRILKEVIGYELYLKLLLAYDGANFAVTNIASAPLKELAPLCQEAIANLAMMLAVPRLSVQVSDAGIRRMETDAAKSAYQYQETNLQESYGRAGFDALEDILQLLQDNVDDYPDYKQSASYTEQNEYLIAYARDFSKYYHIGQSRMTYTAIRYIMKRIEFGALLPLLGREFYRKLKEEQTADSLSDNNASLLNNYIKPAIALLTISKALIERKVDITNEGVTVSIKGNYNNLAQKNTAPMTDTLEMVKQLTIDGNDFLNRLRTELAENAAAYEGYNSISDSSSGLTIQNKITNGIYMI